MKDLLVIKVGTNVLTTQSGALDLAVFESISHQIAALKSQYSIILVSSGAVGAGRELMPHLDSKKLDQRQVLAAVGQSRLIETYRNLFNQHDLMVAQVLTTKEDFRDRTHYLNMRNCLNALISDEVIPIVNENDVISIEELMFTDNDELSGLIAMMMDAKKVVMLTSVDGFYNGNPQDPSAHIIHEIAFENDELEECIQPEKSSFGRGGMHSKYVMAKKLASIGIETIFAQGKQDGIIQSVLEDTQVGTRFYPPASQKKLSSIKKWILFYDDRSTGSVTVNDRASQILADQSKPVSLLMVGVTEVKGNFHKGDIISIFDEQGNALGVGISQWDSESASTHCLQKNVRPLIHYDYLYLY